MQEPAFLVKAFHFRLLFSVDTHVIPYAARQAWLPS
jgi:hypothetical protein